MGQYDVGQVCLNGHGITGSVKSSPEFMKKFCDKCGAATITACPSCDAEIQGRYKSSGVISVRNYEPPAYCKNCGKPYPWTEAKIQAAKELAFELEDLSDGDKQILADNIEDMMAETPRTTLAATRFGKAFKKAGGQAAGALRDIIVDIASETAKKTIWPE